jgi:DNA-binding NtrC family response regulator
MNNVISKFDVATSRDPIMQRVYALAERVAAQPSLNVLIEGETGVGKNVIAETIHRNSAQLESRFTLLNCTALNESSLDMHLFAQGDARSGSVSPVGTSCVRTVFLDGIGDLSSALQGKLLAAIDSGGAGRITRVDGRRTMVRLISATHKNLAVEVARGAFRSDLFFRINAVSIAVPPLRDRIADIAVMAERFLEAAAARMNLCCRPHFSPDALHRLQQHPWPGNVRELRNVVDRAALLCSGTIIHSSELLLDNAAVLESNPADGGAITAAKIPLVDERAPIQDAGPPTSGRRAAMRTEKERIVAALDTCHGNQTRAALLLNMPRRTLVARLTAYAIPRPRKSENPSAAKAAVTRNANRDGFEA